VITKVYSRLFVSAHLHEIFVLISLVAWISFSGIIKSAKGVDDIMNHEISTVEDYIESLPIDRKEVMMRLRKIIQENLPEGFEENFSYGMIGYVIPLSLYPYGYHAKKGEPLPFLSIASQKNYIAFYHMGLYANNEVEEWFRTEYVKRVSKKPDMGKSCIRFKNVQNIPFDLIAELCNKIKVEEYIAAYERARTNRE
jgi:uncharacterized protein YdhG (YjbR/CyaY superfamily)